MACWDFVDVQISLLSNDLNECMQYLKHFLAARGGDVSYDVSLHYNTTKLR